MFLKCLMRRLALVVAAMLVGLPATAGVVVTGTRVIYPAAQKEVTVKLNNEGSLPALVQAWVDTGDMASSPTSSKAPFVISPPVFRIDPAKGQSMRLMFTGASLPQDKESVFWLNLLEIPPGPNVAPDQSMLQMAFRSRLKIFYRPSGLAGTPVDAVEQLQWRLVRAEGGQEGHALQAFNPSAFYVSMVELNVLAGEQRMAAEGGMVGPGESHTFSLQDRKALPPAGAQVEFSAINDYGAMVPVRRPLQPVAAVP